MHCSVIVDYDHRRRIRNSVLDLNRMGHPSQKYMYWLRHGDGRLLRVSLYVSALKTEQWYWYFIKTYATRNVGQCPTWWPPCRIQVAPSAERPKVWLTPTTRVKSSNAAKTRNPFKFVGVPQTGKPRSQPLVGRSSPYCEDICRRYCCLTSFSDCRYMP